MKQYRYFVAILVIILSGRAFSEKPSQPNTKASVTPIVPTILGNIPETIKDLYKEFENPSQAYRIQFLLRTNDEVNPEEIDWQVHSIRQQGGGGVFSYCEHMQEGSPERFLSDWWWKVVRHTASACARYDMLYWAYDEEDWPSGTAGGKLLAQHPDLAWKYIRPAEHQYKGPVTVDIPVGDEPFLAAVAFQMDGNTLRIDSLTDLSEQVANQHLVWQVPAGNWTVAVYTAATGKIFFITGNDYPDLMNPKTGEAFVDLVYRGHDELVKQIPDAKMTGFFTDEPSMNWASYPAGELFPWVPAMPYSQDLPEAFRRRYGYEWQVNLPLLYHEAGPRTIPFRCHHWQTCNYLYSENYFGQIYQFCEERGLIASGHVHVEESLMAHLTLQGGNMLNHFRQMHIPGIDWICPFENPLPANVPKYATSIAHLKGRPRTWCESFAASGWGLNFQQIRRMVNWEHINGINMQIPICYKYSLRGPNRARFYNPGISYQQPYWDHFRGFADYEARLCVLTAGGGHIAQIALAYPSVDMWAHCWDLSVLDARSEIYNRLGDALREAGYDYDILDDEAIQKEAQVANGVLTTATERFPVLLLPPMDAVSRATLEQAVALAKAEGVVLMVGELPRHSLESGADDPEVTRLLRNLLGETCLEQAKKGTKFWTAHAGLKAGFAPRVEDAIEMLHQVMVPDLLLDTNHKGLCAYHRRLADSELYLLLNRRDETRTVRFTLSTQGYPEIWNPVTGSIELVPLANYQVTPKGISLNLTFAPDEIIPLILRPNLPDGITPPAESRKIVKTIPLPGPYRFRIESTMARPHVVWNFAEDHWKLAAESPITPASQPAAIPEILPAGDWCKLGLENFSGLGHYETEIEVPALTGENKAILDLGKVAVSAEVFINEQSAGVVFFDPWQIDITRLLKPGPNHLRIVVANTLANYYGQFEELSVAPRSNGGVKPENKVSGLLGPVVLHLMK